MNKQIIEHIVNYFKIALAFGMLIGLFYVRLIPRVSRDLWENITDKQAALIILTLVLILINIYSLLNTIFLKKSDSWLTKKFIPIIMFIQSCFITLYYTFWGILRLLGHRFFGYDNMHYDWLRWFIKVFIKKEFFMINVVILLGLRYLPRILLLLALMVDVFIYHKFYYTFKFIPFLLLPLLEKVIIFILQDYIDCHFDTVCSFIQYQTISGSEHVRYSYKPEYANDAIPGIKNFEDFFYNHFEFMVQLKNTLMDYHLICAFAKTIYLDFAMAVFRLGVYLYILIYGLNII